MENFFNVYQNSDGLYFYNLIKPLNVYKSDNIAIETTHTFSGQDSWTGLSLKYYQTIDLWWFICMYNGIQNPLKPVETGAEIKILNSQYVGRILEELNKQNLN